MLLAAGGHRVEAACEVTYMKTAVGMVRAGLGITILPASAQEIRAEPELIARAIDDPGFSRPISVVRNAVVPFRRRQNFSCGVGEISR
jgi:DNA-binding transcriptional LysR family regulator